MTRAVLSLGDGPSLGLDARGLEHGPPLVDFGLVESRKCFRRLLLARIDFLSKLRQPMSNRWVGQSVHCCAVELGDHVLWCSLRHKESMPRRHVESRKA